MMTDSMRARRAESGHGRPMPKTAPGSVNCSSTASSAASFVPPAPIRDLRDLTRYRKILIHERTRHANHLCKAREGACITLASTAGRLLGALTSGPGSARSTRCLCPPLG